MKGMVIMNGLYKLKGDRTEKLLEIRGG